MLAVATALVVTPIWLLRRGENEAPEVVPATAADEAEAEPACADAVAALPVRQQVALLVMVGVSGDAPDAVNALLASTDRPGGIFVRPGQAVWESGALAAGAEDGLPLLVAVDDEGGRVQPLAGVLDDLPGAREITGSTPEEVEAAARARGDELLRLGINVVFAPVADVGSAGGIGDRSYGDTADVVIEYAGATARGLRQAGVLPVLKHFPGQGRATADTHVGASATPDLDDLRAVELRPYEALLSEQPTGVMVGHVDVPGLTETDVPASLSPDAIGLLRAGYEFDGLVVTDDLAAMAAVTSRFSVPEAAERALAAGADLILLSQPTNLTPVVDRLVQAVEQGRVPARHVEASLARIVDAAGC